NDHKFLTIKFMVGLPDSSLHNKFYIGDGLSATNQNSVAGAVFKSGQVHVVKNIHSGQHSVSFDNASRNNGAIPNMAIVAVTLVSGESVFGVMTLDGRGQINFGPEQWTPLVLRAAAGLARVVSVLRTSQAT